MSSPRVSLCLIAKDESEFISACLASALPVVDECIVCDTGSTDNTVELARAAGATVVFHPWSDDFSAARNAALDAATGDFILLLDADEQLLPGAAEVLRAALESADFDLAFLPLHHADALDAPPLDVVRGTRRHQEPTGLARLFRRTPDLRWEGMIHESPSTWMARPDLRITTLPVHIVHYGNVPDLRLARGKAERNLALLERHCSAHPDDHPRLAYLSRERLRAEDTAGALAAARAAWARALAVTEATGSVAPSATTCATMLGFLELSLGQHTACRDVVTLAREHGIHHPNIALLHATALLEYTPAPPIAEAKTAATALEDALTRAGEVFVDELLPGATGATASRILGQLRIVLDEPERARAALEEAHRLDPTDSHIRVSLAEHLVHMGRPGPALALVEPLLAPGVPDAWLIAAEAAIAARQREQVEVLLARADKTSEPWLDAKRRRRLKRAQTEHRAWVRVSGLTGGRTLPPVADPDAMLDLARQALESGQLGRAMQVLPSVLATRPGDVDAWCLLASACLQQGGLVLAKDLLKTVTQLAPHGLGVLQLRSDIASTEGNLAAARTWKRLRGAIAQEGFDPHTA